MKSEIKVEKLTLKLNGKSIELTIEEARKLQAELNLAIGDTEPNFVPYHPWPVFVDRTITQPQWPLYPVTTCADMCVNGDSVPVRFLTS